MEKSYKVLDKSGRVLSNYINCTKEFVKKLVKKCKSEGLYIEEI